MIERTSTSRGFIHALGLECDAVPDLASYPFSIPAVALLGVTLHLASSASP